MKNSRNVTVYIRTKILKISNSQFLAITIITHENSCPKYHLSSFRPDTLSAEYIKQLVLVSFNESLAIDNLIFSLISTITVIPSQQCSTTKAATKLIKPAQYNET